MKKISALLLGLLVVVSSNELFGEDDEYIEEARKAAQLFLDSPGEETAKNEHMEFYPLLELFFKSGRDAATKEYRLRCHLYYQGVLLKSKIVEDALKEDDVEECVRKMTFYDQEPISGTLPDWKASKAQKPSFESMLDYFFDYGMTTVSMGYRAGCRESWQKKENQAEFYDFILGQTDGSKQEKIISQYKKWRALDEKRNKRDVAPQLGGTGASLFITMTEIGREDKLSEYLKHMEMMDEITYFQVRCLGKKLFMQNGEVDYLFPKDEYLPAHLEPVAIIIPSTVKKQVIGNDVWHIAVFVPDYLIIHEVKRGGCLVVWKNKQHVASFTWEKDINISDVEFSGQKKVRITGHEATDDEEEGKAVNMEFDFTEPNNKELNVNYGLAEILEMYSKYSDEEDEEDEEKLKDEN